MSPDMSIRGRAIAYAQEWNVPMRHRTMPPELEDTEPLLAAVDAHQKEVLSYAHGPYKLLEAAQDQCDMMIGGGPYTSYSVVELFGEGRTRPGPNGEEYGELWAVPTDLIPNFAWIKGVTMHQIVDTFGYDNPDEGNN